MFLFDAEKYRGKRVCVALSGGLDSVCLLHAFRAQCADMGITLSAIHLEHGIRGEESVRDMEFCKRLCEAWGIPLGIERYDVPRLAKERGGSIEQTARAVRYGSFHALIENGKADLVATAHHADDVAETVLFRLARGTGVSGMRAITEYDGVVRPLLGCTRAEIEAYADENRLPHVEDSTNGDENFTRNYIRKTVLPAFEKIHGNAKKHLVEFAALAAEEDGYLQRLAEDAVVRVLDEEWVPANLPDVLFARACLACMRQYAPDGGYSRANVAEIEKLKGLQSGKKVSLPLGAAPWRRAAVREGEYVVFYWEFSEQAPSEAPFAPSEGFYALPAPFSVHTVGALRPSSAKGKIPRPLFVDLDAFPEGCVVRTRREGDFITPYHAPRKSLKKFLTDRKISARLGKKLPLIARGSEVYAVVGVEIADAVKITEKTVRRGEIS